MIGYVSVAGSDSTEIPIEAPTVIDRDPEDDEPIIAETDGWQRPFEVSDVTVSRKQKNEAPLVITPHSEFIEIYKRGNTNGVKTTSSTRGRGM